jgi:branched-chain amino acid transport system ATP-binding protein
MTALLEVTDLRAYYGEVQALHGISFAVADKGITAVLGANGAGKTTTLRAVCGTIRATGEILLAGERIDGRPTAAIVRRGVGHVPEGRGTFVKLTVEENLRLGAYTRSDGAAIRGDFERMYGYFPVLAQRRHQQAGTMSGGEQQMLAIARALMVRPRLLVLDEPSFGLAPLMVKTIFDIVERINREEGVGMLLVEQNAAIALRMASHAYLLETGRIVISGSAETLRNDEAVRRAYLGY